MRDPRLARLAQVLIHYSLKVQPGQLVRISGIDEIFYKRATDEQLRFVSPLLSHEIEKIDAELGVWGSWNTRSLTGVDPQRMAMRREATRAIQKRFLERAAAGELRWCGTQYPTYADGEVFTGPVESATKGRVRFSFPAIYSAREVQGVTVTFSDGRVVEATADKGEEFLHAMLDLDAGARVLGEFAFGLNYGITKFTRNILFDEKIGGTVHMALGAAYPETGSSNTSGLHWDMICDLRADSEVRADGGEVIYRNGKFLV